MKQIRYFPYASNRPPVEDEISIFYTQEGRALLARCNAVIRPISAAEMLDLTPKTADLLLVHLARNDVRELIGALKRKFKKAATQVMGVHCVGVDPQTIAWFEKTGLMAAFLPIAKPRSPYLDSSLRFAPPSLHFDLFDRVEHLLTGKPIPSAILEVDEALCSPQTLEALKNPCCTVTRFDTKTGRTMTLRLKTDEKPRP